MGKAPNDSLTLQFIARVYLGVWHQYLQVKLAYSHPHLLLKFVRFWNQCHSHIIKMIWIVLFYIPWAV
jgi:hypothetical protein